VFLIQFLLILKKGGVLPRVNSQSTKLIITKTMFGRIFRKKVKFKFSETKNTLCIACSHVLNYQSPILFVTHDREDSIWQFLCGGHAHQEDEAKIASLKKITEIDITVNDLYEMPIGFGAERDKVGDKWRPFIIK
jgi:hypothetical protein